MKLDAAEAARLARWYEGVAADYLAAFKAEARRPPLRPLSAHIAKMYELERFRRRALAEAAIYLGAMRGLGYVEARRR